MNSNFVFSLLVRWVFLMPVLAAFVAALVYLTGAEVIVLVIAHTFPLSLIFLVGACLLCSLLVTLKPPVLFKNPFDKYTVIAGNLVILSWGLTMLYNIFAGDSTIKISNPSTPINGVVFVKPEKVVYPQNVLDEWEQGIWRNTTPACLRTTEGGIDNTCPGSIDVTFCWEMDPTKEWGVSAADCALGRKSQRIFSKGETLFQVPWCRSYEAACLATLKVIEAKALKFK
jgi:hypothetical protein